ncbi:MAG: hypothetical protein KDA49_10920 [Rhodospirillaceae bacterium]|nr:hypothetical protein [Rhodospirillaceae bacterium]MCA8932971.1 hypothetical protein [Rhodospirillaceae bacterium]
MRNLGLMAGGLGVAAVLAAFGPQAAEAQDLSVISMETHAYPSLVNWHERDGRPCCHPETLATDGMVFLDVRGVFDVPWSDTVTRFSASSRDVTVTLPDGTQLNPVGSYDYYGMYHFTASSPSASRPNGWPSEDRDLIYQAIFQIPAGTPSVVFAIGESVSATLTVPAATEAPVAADFATFQVLNASYLAEVPVSRRQSDQDVTGTITAPAGNVFLEMEVEIAGQRANDPRGQERFYFHTQDFHLLDPSGRETGRIGERFMDFVMAHQFNSVNVGSSGTEDMIWSVPAGIASATLYFGDTPVAEINLSGLALPEGVAAAVPAATVAAEQPAEQPAAPAEAPNLCLSGTPVLIESNGTWYPGMVEDGPSDTGECKVSYDGYSSDYNEWVGSERLQAR